MLCELENMLGIKFIMLIIIIKLIILLNIIWFDLFLFDFINLLIILNLFMYIQ